MHQPAQLGDHSAAAPSNSGVVSQATRVSRRYGEGAGTRWALSDVTIGFERGKFTAIMGPSGSGKSTLMHVLAGLDAPTRGSVTLEGSELVGLNDDALTEIRRTHMGFVFQSFNLAPTLDIRENIRLPHSLSRKSAPYDEAWEAYLIETLGLQPYLAQRPSELSGGQQQRVAVARALVNKPAVVFADEPTGNLDLATGREVLQLLSTLSREQNYSVIMVTHDATAASYADRVVFLADGCISKDIPKSTAATISQLMLAEVDA
ncbi:ABC transporter ATP-binding protein [Lysinibacter cavernae]|uniref:ABC transporter ATP-binding protein n=1 Tax=Lysinibacter cavernae TaxID=1640652 RepID=UPI00141DD83C